MLGILGEQTTLFLPLTGPQPPNSSSPQEAKSEATGFPLGRLTAAPHQEGPLVCSGFTLLVVIPKFNYKLIRNVQCRSMPPRLPPTSTSACVPA